MLKIWIGGHPDGLVTDITSCFRVNKTKDWFNDQVVKKIIKDIDKSDAVKDEYIESPILGAIAPERLSCGCKAVIMMYTMNENFYVTKCGDNCFEDIVWISTMKDVEITLWHNMIFPEKFEAIIMNNGKYIHSAEEFSLEFFDLY